MKNNIIQEKSFDFALEIVHLCKVLQGKKEYVLSKQVLRSGTSIGANVREAKNAASPKDFIHKFTIAQKECDESIYWLELLYAGGYIEIPKFDELKTKAEEQLRIIKSIIITTKKKLYGS